MRSPILAILWEFWRRGRWAWLPCILFVAFFTAVPIIQDCARGLLEVNNPDLLTLHLISVVLQALTIPCVILITQGPPARLYALPLPTSHIAGVHLFAGGLTAALLSLATTGLLNALFGFHWPALGAALVLATIAVCVQATTWFGRGSQTVQVVGGTLVLAGLLFWFNSRMGEVSRLPQHPWESVSGAEVAILLVVAGLGGALALLSLARERRGYYFSGTTSEGWFDRLQLPTLDRTVPFRSVAQAQLWFEWRQKGWWLPRVMLTGLALVLGVWGWRGGNAMSLQEGLRIAAVTMIAVGFVASLIIGRYSTRPGRYDMGSFLASRPISDGGITWATFTTAGVSLLISCLLWMAVMIYASSWTESSVSGTSDAIRNAVPPSFLVLVSCWLPMALILCVMMTGRPKPFVIAFTCVAFLMLVASALGTSFDVGFSGLSVNWRWLVTSALTFGATFLTSAVTFAFFIAALRKGLIGWQAIAVGAAVLGMSVALEWSLVLRQYEVDLRHLAVCIAVASLLTAPLAAGPLAVAWNRHR